MHRGEIIQHADALEHLPLRDISRQTHDLRPDAHLGTGAHLVADIDRGRRVVADEKHSERRMDTARAQGAGALRDADPYMPRDRNAVDDLRSHANQVVRFIAECKAD